MQRGSRMSSKIKEISFLVIRTCFTKINEHLNLKSVLSHTRRSFSEKTNFNIKEFSILNLYFFKMMMSLLSLFLVFNHSISHAVVDMKNANYANAWTDIEVPGVGYDLRITRTYNSKSLFDGIFGFGWCSDFETTLTQTPEGNLKVAECGAGQEIYYTPKDFNRKDLEKIVSEIVAKVKAAKKPDEKTLKALSDDLLNDSDLRTKLASAYKVGSSVKEGMTFFANGREVENIKFDKGVFTRNLANGTSMRFNKAGQLILMYDRNQNFLKIEYDNNSIKEVTDNNGRKLSFKLYPNKKIKSINGPSGLVAEYKFKDLNNLSWSKSSKNEIFTYEYDELHNLTKVNYPDKTFISISYNKKNDWVTSFTDREKCRESYNYEFDAKNPKMHYWSVVEKTCGKEIVNKSKHEFWFEERKDGQIFLSRVMTKINDSVTDISYHEVFGKPTSILRNNQRFVFEYYSNGLVKSKNGDLIKMSYEYDSKVGKVSELKTTFLNEKGKVTGSKSSSFRYDEKTNLKYAENSDGLKVTLSYDSKGRIESIIDQTKKVVKIDYEDRFGKPSLVNRQGLGSIKVTYRSTGEIDKVASPEGPVVAKQVASVFDSLMEVINPAIAEVYL